MSLARRLFGFLVPERELDVEPRDHPYYPGEMPPDVIRYVWGREPNDLFLNKEGS